MRRTADALLALLLGFAPSQLHASPEGLPPHHWAYEELEHFEARGFLRLHGTRPFSRTEVRLWVEELDALPEADLSRAEVGRRTRLHDEFVRGADLEAAAARFDPPVLRFQDESWGFAADAALESQGRASPGSDGQAWGRTRLETNLRHGDHFAYETRYSITLEPEEGARTGENHISSRERNWRGLTSDHDRAYLAFERGRLRVLFGRDYAGWGARRGQELLVSDSGLSLDALQVRLRLGRFRLATAAALLSAARNRHYAAHRLEVDWGSLQFGVQEAVVYESPHFDAAYLFPMSFYYGNQFNERADDNVLLGADVKWRCGAGTLDAELLVDDFIYDGDPAPQKIGWRVGLTHPARIGPTDLDLRTGYVRLTRWTYTHRQGPGRSYLAGNAVDGDPLLGHPLGPDADRWFVGLTWIRDTSWTLRCEHEQTRRGDGNVELQGWNPGEAHDLPFPSGVVVREQQTWVGVERRIGRHLDLHWRAARWRDGFGADWRTTAAVHVDL